MKAEVLWSIDKLQKLARDMEEIAEDLRNDSKKEMAGIVVYWLATVRSVRESLLKGLREASQTAHGLYGASSESSGTAP